MTLHSVEAPVLVTHACTLCEYLRLYVQVSLAQAVHICADIRFYELLRSDLLTSGRNSLKVRVFGYHRVKPPAPSKLVPEAAGMCRNTSHIFHIIDDTAGWLSFGPIEKYLMFFMTSACARRTGAASQAFERMHNTLSHRVKT